jgi:hypothetical protein
MPPFELPLFPLHLLPLPGERHGLYIFEERYKLLFDRLEDLTLTEFGIPFVKGDQIVGIGAVMRLVVAEQTSNSGKRNVVVQATDLIQIHRFAEKPTPADKTIPMYPVGQASLWSGWKDWKTGHFAQAEWMEQWVMSKPKDMAMKPPDELIPFLIQVNAPPTLRMQVIAQPNEAKRDKILGTWMKSQRMIRVQERKREDGFFPN